MYKITPILVGMFVAIFILGENLFISLPYLFPYSWVVLLAIPATLLFLGLILLFPDTWVLSPKEILINKFKKLNDDNIDPLFAVQQIYTLKGIVDFLSKDIWDRAIRDKLTCICYRINEIVENIIQNPRQANDFAILVTRLELVKSAVQHYNEVEDMAGCLSSRDNLLNGLQQVEDTLCDILNQDMITQENALKINLEIMETVFK